MIQLVKSLYLAIQRKGDIYTALIISNCMEMNFPFFRIRGFGAFRYSLC